MNSSKLLFKLTFVLATLLVATPFTPTQPSTIRSISSLQVTKEEEAATITDFMGKHVS